MIIENKETRMEPTSVVVEEIWKCDSCKKIICKKNKRPDATKNYSNRIVCYDIMVGHNDWGRDSVDSIKHRQICEECLCSFVNDYFEKASGSEYMEINRTIIHSENIDEGGMKDE